MQKSLLLLASILILGCSGDEKNNGDHREARKEGDSSATFRDVTGGPPEEAKLISAIFKTRKSDCSKGFGICEIDLNTSGAKALPKQDFQNAMFTLDLENDSIVEIEFYEEILQFSNEFVVDDSTSLSDFLGYETITLLPGKYPTQPEKGQYGAVRVNIVKGGKL